ncbi:metal-dependent hydrolase [Veronia pacifica]|uniref:metal-dependent hydrolase n=1 Tax=Veronia pacifica TaxID=1080227 RepID=UPI000A4C456E|nr:metal-dependent hydrolase [Veronia pacifica]
MSQSHHSHTRAGEAPDSIPVVREMDFELITSVPKFLVKDCSFLSGFFYFLSAVFPPGEAYFIRSVQHYSKRIHDSTLKVQVEAFIAQEAHHGKQHRMINDIIEKSTEFSSSKVTATSIRKTRGLTKRYPAAINLAATVALEHLTAVLGAYFLRNESIRHGVHKDMHNMLVWHSIEEIEHKAVAFNVYQKTVNKPGLLRWVGGVSMLQLLVGAALGAAVHTFKQKRFFKWQEWKTAWKYSFGQQGVFRRIWPELKRFLKKGFHPDKVDDSELLEKWTEYIKTYQQNKREYSDIN